MNPQSSPNGTGLGVFTTASVNPPELVITTPDPTFVIEIEILSLPSSGTVSDLSRSAVSVGQTFSSVTSLVYTPPLDTSGTFELSYQVTEGPLVDTALIEFVVAISDGCIEVGREPGCNVTP